MPFPRASRTTGHAALACAWLLVASACSEAAPGPQPPAPAPASASAPPPSSALASAAPSADAPLPDLPAPPAPHPPIQLALGGARAVRGDAGLVTSVEANATRAGVAVLEKGGNAVDAAVAVGFALAVTHPSAGNLGGGGFMLVRKADGTSFALDFRETAPAAVTTEKVVAEVEAGGVGWASTAVPGTVAGLALARDRAGTLPLADLVAPAIDLAKRGHALSPRAAQSLAWQWKVLQRDPVARGIFGRGKEPLAEGDKLVQKDLARTLEAIAAEGPRGFYAGRVGEAIAAGMKQGGGDVTLADLAAYRADVKKPLAFRYRGFDVETMPPPSMGGVALAQTLLTLERRGAHEHPRGSAEALHLFVESAKRAYAERRSVGSDPAFWGDRVPPGALERMLSGRYLEERQPPIDPAHATPASAFEGKAVGVTLPRESPETTHFSVVDAQGNAVSCTVTLSASFGAKVIPPGTGVLLSNALGAFSPSGTNDAAPGKRMASSMSPTLLSRGGRALVVIGSPGGDTIPNVIAQTIVNLVDHRMTVDAAVSAGRVHHQLLPDAIRVEKGREPSREALAGLGALGHRLDPRPVPLGDVKAIVIDEATGQAFGFADPREGGLALGARKKP